MWKKTEMVIILSSARLKKGNLQRIYYSESQDGLTFTKPQLILSPSVGDDKLDNQMIYRSSLVYTDLGYQLYYSAMDKKTRWHIFETPFVVYRENSYLNAAA